MLAEQGCPQALLNLGWLLHRGELEGELEELESSYTSSILSSSSTGAGGSGSDSGSNGEDSTAVAEQQEQALKLPGEAEQLAAGGRQLQQAAETEAGASAAGGSAGNSSSGGSSIPGGSGAVGMSYAEVQHLALELFQRAGRQGEEEGMLVAGHMLFDGQRYGLPAGEQARAEQSRAELSSSDAFVRSGAWSLAPCAARPPLPARICEGRIDQGIPACLPGSQFRAPYLGAGRLLPIISKGTPVKISSSFALQLHPFPCPFFAQRPHPARLDTPPPPAFPPPLLRRQ